MNNKKFLISALIIAIILLFLPIEYKQTVKGKGKLLPYKSWILSKGTDGRLLRSLVDNSTGRNSEFSVTQFERGDAVQFKLNKNVIDANKVLSGDTIGFIISNEIEKNIQKLKGELETARASLKVQVSSEKKSVIDAEKNKLEFAKKQLEEQTKLYERKKKLFDRQLISQQEFEADEAKHELAKINISIVKEELRSVQSGAKVEEVDFATSKINALEKEIDILQRRFENNNITTPIAGMISRSYSGDTLLVVNDTNKYIVLLPVEWKNFSKIKIGQNVEIYSSNVSETGIGKIKAIDNSIVNINGREFVVATVLSETKFTQLIPGLIVDCKVNCGSITAVKYISDFIETIFK